MRDALMKIRVLWIMLRATLQHWRDTVWKQDPDARYCCDGRECGCCAITHREIWINEWRKHA